MTIIDMYLILGNILLISVVIYFFRKYRYYKMLYWEGNSREKILLLKLTQKKLINSPKNQTELPIELAFLGSPLLAGAYWGYKKYQETGSQDNFENYKNQIESINSVSFEFTKEEKNLYSDHIIKQYSKSALIISSNHHQFFYLHIIEMMKELSIVYGRKSITDFTLDELVKGTSNLKENIEKTPMYKTVKNIKINKILDITGFLDDKKELSRFWHEASFIA